MEYRQIIVVVDAEKSYQRLEKLNLKDTARRHDYNSMKTGTKHQIYHSTPDRIFIMKCNVLVCIKNVYCKKK